MSNDLALMIGIIMIITFGAPLLQPVIPARLLPLFWRADGLLVGLVIGWWIWKAA